LAVIDSGLNVPPVEVTQLQPAAVPVPQTAAVREEEMRKARIPVARPRKQARN
jgi:hypothetical protein